MVVERLGVSERRACRYLGQHRSTQRKQPADPRPDEELRGWLIEFAKKKPRYGYRRAHRIALREGFRVNRKKVHRIWKEEGLRVTRKAKKRARVGASDADSKRLSARHADHVWALDFQDDQTHDGRRLRLLDVVDEHTRQVLAIEIDRSITAERTVQVLEKVIRARGKAPRFLRMDNGPELTAWALRDFCRFTRVGTTYIEPGSPWQNGYIESLNARIRDELLGPELFYTLHEARILAEDWRTDHNQNHPHSALGWMSPDEFAAHGRRTGTTTATPTP